MKKLVLGVTLAVGGVLAFAGAAEAHQFTPTGACADDGTFVGSVSLFGYFQGATATIYVDDVVKAHVTVGPSGNASTGSVVLSNGKAPHQGRLLIVEPGGEGGTDQTAAIPTCNQPEVTPSTTTSTTTSTTQPGSSSTTSTTSEPPSSTTTAPDSPTTNVEPSTTSPASTEPSTTDTAPPVTVCGPPNELGHQICGYPSPDLTPTTSTPDTSTSTSVLSGTPTTDSPSTSTTLYTGALPVTGQKADTAWIAVGFCAVGATALVIARRRRAA